MAACRRRHHCLETEAEVGEASVGDLEGSDLSGCCYYDCCLRLHLHLRLHCCCCCCLEAVGRFGCFLSLGLCRLFLLYLDRFLFPSVRTAMMMMSLLLLGLNQNHCCRLACT